MQLRELIDRFRTDSGDKVVPYFHEDAEVIAWLNDAVHEACLRGRLLHESENENICQIQITAGKAQYALDPHVYELTHLRFENDSGHIGRTLSLASEEMLNNRYHGNWRVRIGEPEYAIQSDTGLRLVPRPDQDGKVVLEGYRLPLQEMVNDDDQPELNVSHHVYLVHWALHKAFSIPDNEFFDPNRAQNAELKFSDYFGERPDSDLRRMVREDFEHYNTAIWP